jgi:hypothetical protein
MADLKRKPPFETAAKRAAFADFVVKLDDRDPPSLEVIITYLVGRSMEEGKSKDDLVLMVRKTWDDMSG